ncbi:multiheme c-type cytochrome [Pseudocolwellia sp. AS88]|uniref:multiheme c-type cytochrome n=1 Tax=Pseudocolwellia sp. AS88 TaxID=3063958 RepID=UPI0026F0AD4C|nr:multiheme c-type cytochrome [Pseudocolwellia sp. AS88]MDO7085552.1 multiheme c-type cytochrome [Pseudocolwellia sp. AS88]
MNFLKTCYVVFLLVSIQASAVEEYSFEKSNPISNQTCVSCHQQSQKEWQKSDHAKAMAIPTKQTVLADFNNVNVKHYGQRAYFFIKDNTYQVTISYDDKSDTYPIKYTFGHYPLQQYLVEVEKGKLQVLPFAWDSRDKKQGGQRWYHNYSHEEIRPEDRLHWRQPLQNWNGMCADCHSDRLVRNYDVDNNSFASEFDNINVGCLSCHGDMTNHNTTKFQSQSSSRNVSADVISAKHPTGQWLRNITDKTAHWQGEKRDNSFMDNCFACHSLRSPLTDSFKANTAFLDQFIPQLPSAPNYHTDGQIKEEVYVYGSFLQSKMFTAGVNCLDCHDKHTMKVKVEGNGLCLQCHSNDEYNVKKHHQHESNSTGAQCVNCHMPETTFMGVDDRRDHSFKIPQPHLSDEFNTPNACIKCHEDKSNKWASDTLLNWKGKHNAILPSKLLLMRLNNGEAITLAQHFSIIADEQIPVINRAAAIQLLNFTTPSIPAEDLVPYLSHKEALIRLSAASAITLSTPEERLKYLIPLLKDKYRSIRVSTARGLIGMNIPNVNKTAFDNAFNELVNANNLNSWRGEGRGNQALLAMSSNNLKAAEKSLVEAIKIDPYFEAAYINLADIYRTQQRTFQVNSVLAKGIKNLPKSAALHYSYGLYFVRQKNMEKAIGLFDEAMMLMPDNSQYAYTYVLALDGMGQSEKALNTLKALIVTYQDTAQLKELGLYLSQKLRLRSEYNWFMKLK